MPTPRNFFHYRCEPATLRAHDKAAGHRCAYMDAKLGAIPQGCSPWRIVRAARSQCGQPPAFWRGYLEALLEMGYR